MSFSVRWLKVGYLAALALVVALLVQPGISRAQFKAPVAPMLSQVTQQFYMPAFQQSWMMTAGGGSAMGGMGMMGMGGMMGMSHDATWAINGMSMTGDGQASMPPLLTLQNGRSYLLTLRNDTAWWHPMHLHGHSFRVISRNGVSVPHRQWADTVLIPPKETVDIAFVADNPGDWMLHCHVTDHQVSGMMTVLRIV